MEGLSFNGWQINRDMVRRKNSAQARSITKAFQEELGRYIFGILLLATLIGAFANFMINKNVTNLSPVYQEVVSASVTPSASVDERAPVSKVDPAGGNTYAMSTPVDAKPQTMTSVSPETVKTIVVEKGDTLSELVGNDWPQVCEANGLSNCDLIFPGQTITVSVQTE